MLVHFDVNGLDANGESKVKAAVLYEANSPMAIEEISVRKPGAKEVLVRTSYSGLCHSDLHFMEGLVPYPMPVVLGHEASGVVEQVGEDVTYVKPGDHVVTCLSVFCGTCESCLSGRPNICTDTDYKLPAGVSDRLEWAKPTKLNQFTNLSSFAEQMLVHENALSKIRKDMPLDRAALIGCGIMTGFGAATRTAGIRPGETVAIVGCGGVGMAALNGAVVAGAGRVIAVDTSPEKLELATKLGATDVVNPNDGDPVEIVKELTQGGVEHALECLGLKLTAGQAFRMTRPGGVATIVGLLPLGETVDVSGFDLMYERKLQGSLMGGGSYRIDMPRLIDHYMSGRLRLDEWISQTIRLEDINKGFDDLKSGKGVRSVIDFT